MSLKIIGFILLIAIFFALIWLVILALGGFGTYKGRFRIFDALSNSGGDYYG